MQGSQAPGEEQAAAPEKSTEKNKIYALDTRVFIYQKPRTSSPEIGALRIGEGVAVKSMTPLLNRDCPGSGSAEESPSSRAAAEPDASASGATPQAAGWYQVEPHGYICADRRATLNANHPLVLAKQKYRTDYKQNPPLRWGESLEAPIYRRHPTAEEQKRSEYQLGKHLERVEHVREALAAGEAPNARSLARLRGASAEAATKPLPSFLDNHQDSPWAQALLPQHSRARLGFVPARSTIAWLDEFEAGGRSWLLTPELTLVPKDRVLEQKPSHFQGVFIEEPPFGLAFIKKGAAAKWRFKPNNSPEETKQVKLGGLNNVIDTAPVDLTEYTGQFLDITRSEPGTLERLAEEWPRLAALTLTGRTRLQAGKPFFETTESGLWVAQDAGAIITWKNPQGINISEGEKWLDVSIFHGTLVAYEGTRPRFATLISAGANGYRSQKQPERKNTTPSGTYRIEWKHRSTTMSPDPERKRYYLTDVPYTQFFHMPFALHAAYWHDRFGEPMSGGCVNLSVVDAEWLFNWTAPSLPEGWHSVRSGEEHGQGTWVRVR